MMIKQQIVVKVQMNCQKCRTKALETVTSFDGVEEVKIEGKEKDQVVVIGEDVDVIRLVKSLRKKVWRQARILSLDEVKPKQDKSKPKQDKPKPVCPDPKPICHPPIVIYDLGYDPNPGYCCIM